MTRFCKVYMNEELIETEKDLDEDRYIGLYAWGRVLSEDDKGKVELLPTTHEFDILDWDDSIIVRERRDVTWMGDPIKRKRYINDPIGEEKKVDEEAKRFKFKNEGKINLSYMKKRALK